LIIASAKVRRSFIAYTTGIAVKERTGVDHTVRKRVTREAVVSQQGSLPYAMIDYRNALNGRSLLAIDELAVDEQASVEVRLAFP
jgi:hypothetical protein